MSRNGGKEERERKMKEGEERETGERMKRGKIIGRKEKKIPEEKGGRKGRGKERALERGRDEGKFSWENGLPKLKILRKMGIIWQLRDRNEHSQTWAAPTSTLLPPRK